MPSSTLPSELPTSPFAALSPAPASAPAPATTPVKAVVAKRPRSSASSAAPRKAAAAIPAIPAKPARKTAAPKVLAAPAAMPAAKSVKVASKPAAKTIVKAVGKPKAAATAAATAKPQRVKEKLVRDSFTMPRADFALVHQLKERALGFRRATKKSELLRAGLQALSALEDRALQAMLEKLTAIKAGRPKKGD